MTLPFVCVGQKFKNLRNGQVYRVVTKTVDSVRMVADGSPRIIHNVALKVLGDAAQFRRLDELGATI